MALEFRERKIRQVSEEVAQKVLGGATADKYLLEEKEPAKPKPDKKPAVKSKGVRMNFFLDEDLYKALLKFQFEQKNKGKKPRDASFQKIANDGVRYVLRDYLG